MNHTDLNHNPVHVSIDTPVRNGNDQLIDQWELKAANRALANLRELLYGQPMLDLIGPQVAESERRAKQYADQSNGEFRGTQVNVQVQGLSSAELFSTLRASAAANNGTPEQVKKTALEMIFPMQPEHYALAGGVIEPMGGLPTLTKPVPMPDAPQFVKDLLDKSYPIRVTGQGPLPDGTPFTYMLQQFRDTPAGMEAELHIWYPAACPPEYLEEHAEHYAVEFRNACRMARKARTMVHH